jgi:hypothetical protein
LHNSDVNVILFSLCTLQFFIGNRVGIGSSYRPARARICKRLRRPGIDSEDSIPPGWESIPGLLNRFKNTGSGMAMEEAVIAFVKREISGLIAQSWQFVLQ